MFRPLVAAGSKTSLPNRGRAAGVKPNSEAARIMRVPEEELMALLQFDFRLYSKPFEQYAPGLF
jgi:hypothetical protein